MSDKSKVLAGFIIFVCIISVPFWINAGKTKEAPEPVLSDTAKKAGSCIEENMAANHMQILDLWRDTVVRGTGERVYVNSKGEKFGMSLSTGPDSCLGCHVSKADFCDKCHTYASVDPYCWECHIDPKENK